MLNKLTLLLLLLSMAPAAFALNLQGYRFSDSYRYGLLDDGLAEVFPGKNVFTASYGYVHSPLYYGDTYLHEVDKEIIDENQVLTGGFTRYLSDRVSMGLDLNVVHNTVFNDTETTLGDSVLKAKFNLLRTKALSYSVNPQVFIPTGDTDNFSGMKSIGGALSFVAEKSLNRLHFLASLGAFSSKDNLYSDVDHRQLLLSQLGASYDVTETLNVNFEMWRNFPLVDDTYQDDGKYFLTARHKTFPRASVYGGAGVTGLSDVTGRSYSGFIGLKFYEEARQEEVEEVTAMAAAPLRHLRPAYFGHDRDYLEGDEIHHFRTQGERLLGLAPNERVRLEGYASHIGPSNYNMKLSKRRAQRIRTELEALGVPSEKIDLSWFGEAGPQDPVEGLNRRVHFEVITKKENL